MQSVVKCLLVDDVEENLLALIQRVVKEHQSAFPQRRIEVWHEGDCGGDWDSGRLAQAASNLIGNALQHGEIGEPIRVRVDGTRADEVAISISNTGVIPADVMTRLFEPFHGGQLESGRRRGLGLGLFIVQQIVQAHGGAADDVIDARAGG